MDIAALILSIISLISSMSVLVIMLAKNFFSSHTVQYVDPFKDAFPKEIGKSQVDQYADLDLPMDQEEIEALMGRKSKFKE